MEAQSRSQWSAINARAKTASFRGMVGVLIVVLGSLVATVYSLAEKTGDLKSSIMEVKVRIEERSRMDDQIMEALKER